MTDSAGQGDFARAQIIKTDLPVLLSKLVLAGREEQALNLLVDWGTHAKTHETIWNEAKALLNHSERE